MRRIVVITLLCLSMAAGRAEEAVVPWTAGLRGTIPVAGDWVEYLVSFPVDPLENSLAQNPSGTANLPGGVAEGADPLSFIQPSFEPPIVWRSIPLRLEILAELESGLQVRMSLDGHARTVILPLRPADSDDYPYDDGGAVTVDGSYPVGETEFRVAVERRTGGLGGYVRMTSGDLPFGLARFASENVDLALVGMGDGEPPGEHLPWPAQLSPPPGLLYEGE